uniref:Mitochondrial fission factor n=1 Tax=Otolemur garnettii TaxID=30611 RepID=H0XYV8_OTOGA
YTTVISQQIKVPEKLKVAPNDDLQQEFQGVLDASVMMRVPNRTVIVGDSEDIPFSRPAQLDHTQVNSLETLGTKTATSCTMLPEDRANLSSARGILSLIQSSTRRAYQQVLDALEENQRPMLSGRPVAGPYNPHHDIRHGSSNIDTAVEGTSEDMSAADAASLRRQIIKLNRRLQLLEEDNKERARREMIMYSITVAFWLLNSWLWFRR